MEIAEFLLARIAEDEAVAQEWPADRLPPPNGDALWIDALGHPIYQPRARVLAECEAKRRIVRALAARGPDAGLTSAEDRGATWAFRETCKVLAVAHADHPDFDPAWSLTGADA